MDVIELESAESAVPEVEYGAVAVIPSTFFAF